jgi:hypothetical protein
MTLQEQIEEYRHKQAELFTAAEACAQNNDFEGFAANVVEAFYMEHPVTAMLKSIKIEGGFSGGTEMRMPIRYDDESKL